MVEGTDQGSRALVKPTVCLAALLGAACLNGLAAAQDFDSRRPADPPGSSLHDDPTDPTHWQERVRAARAQTERWRFCVAAHLHGCIPSLPPSPMDRLLIDETLRPGDIVSMPDGLRVFRGNIGETHRLEDFRPLSGK